MYWGCESTVLRGSAFNMPYKENSRFFPARETGNLKINMARQICRRRHSLPVQPVTLTMIFH